MDPTRGQEGPVKQPGDCRFHASKEWGMGGILILFLNVNGLWQHHQGRALDKHIASMSREPDARVLEETHLKEAEIEHVQCDACSKAHSHCREGEVGHECGGVLIMV